MINKKLALGLISFIFLFTGSVSAGDSVSAKDCSYGGKVKSIEATGDLEVTFTMCKPDPAFRAKAAFTPFSIQPKEYLDWIKYYAEQLPAPGDYILPEKKIRGGRIAEGKPNSDVDWSIYKATYQTPPGPGDYNNDYSTSMVVQSIQAKKGAVLQGKVVQGNSRTTVPSNFTMFKNVTTGISSTTCRTDPSMGKQIVSHQTSAPSFSFGARTDAESIYSESIYLTKLHNPPPRRRKKYKKKKMYKKDTTLVSEGAEREWSTVVDIFITHPSFKPVSLFLSRSHLSKIPQTSLF